MLFFHIPVFELIAGVGEMQKHTVPFLKAWVDTCLGQWEMRVRLLPENVLDDAHGMAFRA